MAHYKITYFRYGRYGAELLQIIEMDRECLTSRDYKDVILLSLFDLALEGAKNKYLTAYLMRDDEKKATFRCNTRYDELDDEINVYVYVGRPREQFRKLRRMNIAH